jgi:hypothetical protein
MRRLPTIYPISGPHDESRELICNPCHTHTDKKTDRIDREACDGGISMTHHESDLRGVGGWLLLLIVGLLVVR